MTKKKLEEFLRRYVDVLRDDMDWGEVAPCHPRTRMAGGYVEVLARGGDVMAFFTTSGTPPSMPISPRDVQAARLLCDAINYLAGSEG